MRLSRGADPAKQSQALYDQHARSLNSSRLVAAAISFAADAATSGNSNSLPNFIDIIFIVSLLGLNWPDFLRNLHISAGAGAATPSKHVELAIRA